MQPPNRQRRYLPSHAVLRSFECAARHCSFTLAAEELHLTQSAISRQVKELEEMIGTNLFRRVGRRLVLTIAGAQLADEIAVDLDNIHQTIMRAISAGRQGTMLKVAVLPTFASRWLIPRLPEFAALHPEIELSFSTRLEPFDMTRERFDLAVHFGAQDWPDTDMRPLCRESMVPVAAPDFVKAHGLHGLDALRFVPLLHMETRPLVWRQFFDAVGLEPKTAMAGKYFDQFSMVIAAAVASLGAALLPAYLIEHELAEGQLVRLGEEAITTENSYFLVTPSNRAHQQVGLFCDWMVSAISETTLGAD